jgi:hypothetical protein
MAQETAGTIGIPVLKNELLPYLENYARRQERAAALEAARQRQKDAMEYKRLNELQKVGVPDVPAPKGGYFQGFVDEDRNAFTTIATEAAKKTAKGEMSPGDFQTAINLGKSEVENRANKALFQSERLAEHAKKMQDYGVNATPGLISQYVKEGKESVPNFFDAPHTEAFTQYALQNPANINPGKIAQVALKDFKQEQVEIESGGKVEKLSYYPIFKVGAKKTTDGKDIVGATEVDIPVAEMAVNRNPELKVAKDAWIKGTAAKNMFNPAYRQLPEAERKVKAVEEATKEFYDQFAAQYKTEKFGRRYESPKGGRGGRSGAYAKFRVGSAEIKTAQGGKVPVYEMTGPSRTDVDVEIPQNTTFYNTANGAKEVLTDAGAKLMAPSIGWMAVDKAGKEIDPKDWGRTSVKDVKFIPGVYGIKSSLQAKGTTSFINIGGASGQSGPYLTGDQIFIEEGLPGFKTLANGILTAQGSSYETAKAKALSETKRKFLQPGKVLQKRKFRTSK